MANIQQYITNQGIIIPDTSSLKSEIENEFKNSLGADLDVTSSTPQGRLIEAETIARSEVLTTNALIANTFNPNTSFGVFLDAICALTGTTRKQATHTEVLATVTGEVGTVIPAGATVQTSAGDIFENVNDYTIPAGGTGTTYFQSVESGPIPCAVNTLTQIVTGVMGWETINNPVAASIGVDVESDYSLRQRRLENLYYGVSLIPAMEAALKRLDGVLSCKIIDNYTNAQKEVDEITIDPHSIFAVVDGGSNQDIFDTLLKYKSLGCGYTGNVEGTAYNSGVSYTVKFNRPTYQSIDLSVTVKAPQGTTSESIISQVKDAIANWASGNIEGVEGLKLGTSVSPFECAAAITSQVPDLFVTNVELALHGESLASETVDLYFYEKAIISDENITVTVI